MIEKKRKTTPSIQALENIKTILFAQCEKSHNRRRPYTGSDTVYNESKAYLDLNTKKTEMIERISKEIEEYTVKKYEKYGVTIVPVCHRKDKSGDDRLNLDLKVKNFVGLEKLFEENEKEEKSFKADLEKIDDWYWNALQAVTKREELPDVPQFKQQEGGTIPDAG